MPYIDRDIAIEVLKSNVEELEADPYYGPHPGVPEQYIEDILVDEVPVADVVEVKCRCADCKHYNRYGRNSLVFNGKNVKVGWCCLRAKFDEDHRMLPFDFCSYGERTED